MKEFRNPQNVHQPLGSYSHQIEIKGNERMLILFGQVGMRPDGTVPEDPIEQLDIALENIFSNLQAANMGVKDIIKLTYYLVGEIDTQKGASWWHPGCRDTRPVIPWCTSRLWPALFIRLRLMPGQAVSPCGLISAIC